MKTLNLFALCACAALLWASPALAESFTNSIGMEFVKIPAGSYKRGCDPNFGEKCQADETPERRISISTFWLGKYEVTQAQWVAVMGSNPSDVSNRGRNKPVDWVSWNDAQEFIRRLNKKEGHNRYRLPTEAEWEYAYRAGSRTQYAFGDDRGQLAAHEWYQPNCGPHTGGRSRLHPVGRLRPNAWGLYDMQGNVSEWCSDWYDGNYYRWSKKTADPEGPDAAEERVMRGCGCAMTDLNLDNVEGDTAGAENCRAAKRGRGEPDRGYSAGGFRVAVSPKR